MRVVLHPLGSPTSSQGRGESCHTDSKYPWGHLFSRLPGSVSPFPSSTHKSWSSERLGNGHSASGRLVKPAQPCSGEGQPSHPLGLNTAQCLHISMPNKSTLTVLSACVLTLSYYPEGQSRHFSVSIFYGYVASMHPLGMLHSHVT